tara:strand:- start:131 stop:313 length:183 start_codon:yes stop_codon:yes gene_type:complete
MSDFFEIDEQKKTLKVLNLDELSIEDLEKYIQELKFEISRVQDEIKIKTASKSNAEKFFK